MIRSAFLGLALAAGLMSAAPQAAQAGDFSIGIQFGHPHHRFDGPFYGDGFYHRPYRGGFNGIFFEDRHYRGDFFHGHRPRAFRHHFHYEDCRVVRSKRWNGHRWVRVKKRVCYY